MPGDLNTQLTQLIHNKRWDILRELLDTDQVNAFMLRVQLRRENSLSHAVTSVLSRDDQWQLLHELVDKNLMDQGALRARCRQGNVFSANALITAIDKKQYKLISAYLERDLITQESLEGSWITDDSRGPNAVRCLAEHGYWDILTLLLEKKLLTRQQLIAPFHHESLFHIPAIGLIAKSNKNLFIKLIESKLIIEADLALAWQYHEKGFVDNIYQLLARQREWPTIKAIIDSGIISSALFSVKFENGSGLNYIFSTLPDWLATALKEYCFKKLATASHERVIFQWLNLLGPIASIELINGALTRLINCNSDWDYYALVVEYILHGKNPLISMAARYSVLENIFMKEIEQANTESDLYFIRSRCADLALIAKRYAPAAPPKDSFFSPQDNEWNVLHAQIIMACEKKMSSIESARPSKSCLCFMRTHHKY